MVALTPGKMVASKSPTITVDAGLAAGAHVIQLIVIDNSGNASRPTSLAVTVRARRVTVPGTVDTTTITDRPLDPAIVEEVVQPPTPVDPVIKAAVAKPAVAKPTAAKATVAKTTTAKTVKPK